MVLAEDLDVDGPVVVVEAFNGISAHAKVLGPTHFVDRTVDLEGCATHISHKEVSRVVEFRDRQDARQRYLDDVVPTLVTVTNKEPPIRNATSRNGYIVTDVSALAQHSTLRIVFGRV